MDARQLENTLRTVDFPNRFEKKLKSFVDNELLTRVFRQRRGDNEEAEISLLDSIAVFHEYYSKVLKLFYPLIMTERVEETKDNKSKRKLEFKEKLLTEFKQAYLNHLKYSVLDAIGYAALFEKFITLQFPLWQRQVDQSEFELSLTESENLDYIRRLLQDAGQLPDMDIESDNNQLAFDSKVGAF